MPMPGLFWKINGKFLGWAASSAAFATNNSVDK
jgi:hypothetical protein